jgi:ligand-binding SRPBCC domain-containing protein
MVRAAMKTIRLTTLIAAPVDRCFKLSTSVDLHMAAAKRAGEVAIDGVTSGLMREGERVTWRGRHFGLKLTHESLLEISRPYSYFRDVMVRGAFAMFEHEHYFAPMNDGTRMRDELRFAAPLGPLGWLAERMFLKRHLTKFLRRRNAVLKEVAESDQWRRYLDVDSKFTGERSSGGLDGEA